MTSDLNCTRSHVKLHRLLDTAFKQQRLKAWQPILTPKSVLPTLLIVGLIFAPIGGVLIWGSNQVGDLLAWLDLDPVMSMQHRDGPLKRGFNCGDLRGCQSPDACLGVFHIPPDNASRVCELH